MQKEKSGNRYHLRRNFRKKDCILTNIIYNIYNIILMIKFMNMILWLTKSRSSLFNVL